MYHIKQIKSTRDKEGEHAMKTKPRINTKQKMRVSLRYKKTLKITEKKQHSILTVLLATLLSLTLLHSSKLKAFDTNEHTYLGDCINLRWAGGQGGYKGEAKHTGAYEILAGPEFKPYVGTLCPKLAKEPGLIERLPLNKCKGDYQSFDYLRKTFQIIDQQIKASRKVRYASEKVGGGSGSDRSSGGSDSSDGEGSSDCQATEEEDLWTIGEIISIAGDYIMEPDDGAISDPLYTKLPDEMASFPQAISRHYEKMIAETGTKLLKAFSYMKRWDGNPFFREGSKSTPPAKVYGQDLIQEEFGELFGHFAHMIKGTSPSSGDIGPVLYDPSFHRNAYVTKKTLKAQLAEISSDGKPHAYMKLLSENVDHFAPDAQMVYQIGHNMACSMAIEAKRLHEKDGDARQTNAYLAEAYALEAFSDHFFSDLFSAGHIRAPRRQLLQVSRQEKWGTGDKHGSLLGNIVHDTDGWVGLKVCNNILCNNNDDGQTPNPWTAYGDYSLFDKKSETNRNLAISALQTGFNEIWTCFADPGDREDEESLAYRSIHWQLIGGLDQVPRLYVETEAQDPQPIDEHPGFHRFFRDYKPYPTLKIGVNEQVESQDGEYFKRPFAQPQQAIPLLERKMNQAVHHTPREALQAKINQEAVSADFLVRTRERSGRRTEDTIAKKLAYHSYYPFHLEYTDARALGGFFKKLSFYTEQSIKEPSFYPFFLAHLHNDPFTTFSDSEMGTYSAAARGNMSPIRAYPDTAKTAYIAKNYTFNLALYGDNNTATAWERIPKPRPKPVHSEKYEYDKTRKGVRALFVDLGAPGAREIQTPLTDRTDYQVNFFELDEDFTMEQARSIVGFYLFHRPMTQGESLRIHNRDDFVLLNQIATCDAVRLFTDRIGSDVSELHFRSFVGKSAHTRGGGSHDNRPYKLFYLLPNGKLKLLTPKVLADGGLCHDAQLASMSKMRKALSTLAQSVKTSYSLYEAIKAEFFTKQFGETVIANHASSEEYLFIQNLTGEDIFVNVEGHRTKSTKYKLNEELYPNRFHFDYSKFSHKKERNVKIYRDGGGDAEPVFDITVEKTDTGNAVLMITKNEQEELELKMIALKEHGKIAEESEADEQASASSSAPQVLDLSAYSEHIDDRMTYTKGFASGSGFNCLIHSIAQALGIETTPQDRNKIRQDFLGDLDPALLQGYLPNDQLVLRLILIALGKDWRNVSIHFVSADGAGQFDHVTGHQDGAAENILIYHRAGHYEPVYKAATQ